MTARIEDVFAGHVELTSEQVRYVRFALGALLAERGGSERKDLFRRDAHARLSRIIGDLVVCSPSSADCDCCGVDDRVFAGHVELTASERGYLGTALSELYMSGGYRGIGDGRRLRHEVLAALGNLRLDKMVSIDGTRLVSTLEHAASVLLVDPLLLVYPVGPGHTFGDLSDQGDDFARAAIFRRLELG